MTVASGGWPSAQRVVHHWLGLNFDFGVRTGGPLIGEAKPPKVGGHVPGPEPEEQFDRRDLDGCQVPTATERAAERVVEPVQCRLTPSELVTAAGDYRQGRSLDDLAQRSFEGGTRSGRQGSS